MTVAPAPAPFRGSTQQRTPNLVIVGVSRGGTTSLFNYLSQHPDVGCSDVKEVRYFAPLRYGEPLPPLEEYTRHFDRCRDKKVVMEATPGYFYGGRPLAHGLKNACPDVQAVVSLRSPVDRCWSWYGFVKSRLRIDKQMGFDEYLDRCEQLHAAGVDGLVENQPFWGLGGGCYDHWLEDWTAELGSRFRVIFFDDLIKRPDVVVGSLCDYLELDPPGQDMRFAADNKTTQYRRSRVQQVAIKANRRGEAFFRRHRTAKRILRSGYYALNRAPEDRGMSAEQRERLLEFYRPHNARLGAQLSRLGLRVPATWPA